MTIKKKLSCGLLSATMFLGTLTLTPQTPVSARPKLQSIPTSTQISTPDPADADASPDAWLLKERIVFLSSEIDGALAEKVMTQLLYLDAIAPGKDIYLYLNSPGGEIPAGMAIYDTLRSLRSDVVTVSIGSSMSMASLLLAAGTKGKRLALPNTRIMIHQPLLPRVYITGQASEVAIEAKELLYLKRKLGQLMADLTGQPLSRIEADSDRDFYLSAQEAKAYGLVDRVVHQLPSASRP